VSKNKRSARFNGNHTEIKMRKEKNKDRYKFYWIDHRVVSLFDVNFEDAQQANKCNTLSPYRGDSKDVDNSSQEITGRNQRIGKSYKTTEA
jgi:hypothetical protein